MAVTDTSILSNASTSEAGTPENESGDLGGPANVRPIFTVAW